MNISSMLCIPSYKLKDIADLLGKKGVKKGY